MAADQRLREATATLADSAAADLAQVWAASETLSEAASILRDALPGILDGYGSLAGIVAAEWYDTLRTEASVPRFFVAEPAPLPNDFGVDALAGWSQTVARDMASMQSLVEMGAQRRLADVARETVMLNSLADPSSVGWQRVGVGSCAFCLMLISRGAVYSESTARFASHDGCKCSAQPAWSNQPLPVRPYTPTSRRVSDADRARVSDYLVANRDA